VLIGERYYGIGQSASEILQWDIISFGDMSRGGAALIFRRGCGRVRRLNACQLKVFCSVFAALVVKKRR
jgi:hypothetical protein